MELKISKELLSAVLGVNVTYMRHDITNHPDLLFFETDDVNMKRKFSPVYPYVNVYELMHKCKEWANNLSGKRYQLYSGIAPRSLGYSTCDVYSGAIEQCKSFEANTEVEAVLLACNWITGKIGW